MSYSLINDSSVLDIRNAHLRVAGNIEAQAVKVGAIELNAGYSLERTANVGNTTSNTIQFTNEDTSFITSGNVAVGKDLVVSGNVAMSKDLTVSGNVEVGTANLFVDTVTGNVGIGMTIPSNKLHISGTQNQLVQIQNTSDTARMVLNGSSGTGGDLIFKEAGTATWGIASIGDNLHFLGDDSTSQTRMTINNDGIVTTPYKPAFYAWDNSTSRSGTTLTFNSTTYNVGSHFNTSTSRFKTPVAGTYIFAAVIAHDTANTLADVYYSFYVDGVNHRDIIEGTDTHDMHYETHGVYIVNLDANQYVDIRSRGGHNITFINGDHGPYYRNCFQGALLG